MQNKRLFYFFIGIIMVTQNFLVFSLTEERETELKIIIANQDAKKIEKIENQEEKDWLLLYVCNNYDEISKKEINNTKILELLIQQGANINAVNSKSNTPLMIACYGGELSYIKCLVENGADILHRNKSGSSAFTICLDLYSAEKRQRMAEYILYNLFNRHPDINVNEDLQPEIKAALDSNDEFIIAMLLNRGLNPNLIIKVDKEEIPILVYSIMKTKFYASRILVKAGADVRGTVYYKNEKHHLLYYIPDYTTLGFKELLLSYGAPELTTAEKEQKERERIAAEIESKNRRRKSSDNFYDEAVCHRGESLLEGDVFLLDSRTLEVVDRVVAEDGYAYLVNYLTNPYIRQTKYCFYIVTGKELSLKKQNIFDGYGGYNTCITNDLPLRLECYGIGKYSVNFQSVDCYIFVGIEDESIVIPEKEDRIRFKQGS